MEETNSVLTEKLDDILTQNPNPNPNPNPDLSEERLKTNYSKSSSIVPFKNNENIDYDFLNNDKIKKVCYVEIKNPNNKYNKDMNNNIPKIEEPFSQQPNNFHLQQPFSQQSNNMNNNFCPYCHHSLNNSYNHTSSNNFCPYCHHSLNNSCNKCNKCNKCNNSYNHHKKK